MKFGLEDELPCTLTDAPVATAHIFVPFALSLRRPGNRDVLPYTLAWPKTDRPLPVIADAGTN